MKAYYTYGRRRLHGGRKHCHEQWSFEIDRSAKLNVGFEREEGESAALAAKAKDEKWASRSGRRLSLPGSAEQTCPGRDCLRSCARTQAIRRRTTSLGGENVTHDVVIEAEGLAESDVKPRLTCLTIENLADLAAKLGQDPEWDLARTKDARSTIVKRFLKSKYGFVMPTVVDQLASRKS